MTGDAEDRTEAATPRRLEKAREEGQVASSKELVAVAGLSAGLMAAWASFDSAAFARLLAAGLRLDGTAGAAAWRPAALTVLLSAAPTALAASLAAVLVSVLQSGFLFRTAALQPDLSRLSPLAGLKRMAGWHTLSQLLKSLAKIGVFGACLWAGMARVLPGLPAMVQSTPAGLLRAILHRAGLLILLLLGAQLAIAGADIGFERFSLARKLRMSRQELKDEHKETEGNPQVKLRLRQLARQRLRKRMLLAVPKAAVVITNPTHYAVALAYERGSRAAPRLTAKGVDDAAAKIREIAREFRIPVVANPALARALFRLDIDTEIPAEHFKAVAEIIAYVWRLKGKARR